MAPDIYNVPDTPESLTRWIWQHYVGIPAADQPPYDKEFTRLFDRIESLNRQAFTAGLAEARKQYQDTPMMKRATGRTIPDLTKREHVCEYQNTMKAEDSTRG